MHENNIGPSSLSAQTMPEHERGVRRAHLVLVDVGVEELLVGGVDDGGAVGGGKDVGLAVGAEAAQHDGLGAQADLLALAQRAGGFSHVEVVQLPVAHRAQQVGHPLKCCAPPQTLSATAFLVIDCKSIDLSGHRAGTIGVERYQAGVDMQILIRPRSQPARLGVYPALRGRMTSWPLRALLLPRILVSVLTMLLCRGLQTCLCFTKLQFPNKALRTLCREQACLHPVQLMRDIKLTSEEHRSGDDFTAEGL